MLDFKKLEEILEIIDNKGFFNQFIIDLLDYKLQDFNRLIIRYKIEHYFVIDIYDYKKNNKFTRYYFIEDNNIFEKTYGDVIVNVVNLKKYYKNFDNNNKFSLFSSLFYETDIKRLQNNLDKLFCKEINNIIMKHLKN